MENYEIIKQLKYTHSAARDQLLQLLSSMDTKQFQYLLQCGKELTQAQFKNKIYTRGLIEFTNFCKNDCYYCGIRKSNKSADRYRLTKEQILECCKNGYQLGFRTFVLQGGEDPYYSETVMTDIIAAIHKQHPDCAITISFGEHTKETYKAYYTAGADRYLLRHETANPLHYEKLHPKLLTLQNRLKCLQDLKEIGFQTGCGFMIGSPYQTTENIVEDILFIKQFAPHMIGVGPFIPHKDTGFYDRKPGDLQTTLAVLAILRLMNPNAMIPATTALGSIHATGREQGIEAGANVLMFNLSPTTVKEKYVLYNNKICLQEDTLQSVKSMEEKLQTLGYTFAVDRGDYTKI